MKGPRTITRASRESNLPPETIKEQAILGNVGQYIAGRFLFSWEDVQWLIQNVPKPNNDYKSREWLYEELWTKRKTAHQIAREYGTTDSTIRYWCQKLGVPTPSRSEARRRVLGK